MRILNPQLSILLLAAAGTGQALVQEPGPSSVVAAQRLLRQDRWEEAAEKLQSALESDDSNALAWYLLGRAVARGPNWEEALEYYRAAAEFEPFAARAHYAAARLCATHDLTEDAFAHLELAFEAGFAAHDTLRDDPDLGSLRADDRFQVLLSSLPSSSELFEERPRILHTFYGEAPGDVFGWIGRNMGDADGDGKADLLISAPQSAEGGPAAGKIYVYSGATGDLLFERVGEAGHTLGIGIEAAGDVNDDGHADAICGAANVGFGAGVAHVYSGKDGATLLTLTTGEAEDALGRKVSGGVDFDDDGHDDVLVGAPGAGTDGQGTGKAYLYSGRTGAILATIEGERAGDAFGAGNAVWARGEMKLLAIGAANAGPRNGGRTYVYRWENGAVEPFFTIESDETGVALGGMFVCFPGDMNGDGISEVYASDWQNAAGGNQTGRIYVHSGADGERLFTMTGHRAGEGFGTCTADVGDVDGDGLADLLVGAWQAPDAAPGGGKCYLYDARRELIGTYTCNVPGETLGFDTTGVGDLDGDGGIDFLVTGGYSGVSGPRSGRAFVIAGPVPPEK